MTERNEWSGLAPAVDAHLAYWDRARRNITLADLIVGGSYDTDELAEANIRRAVENPYLYRWVVFGSSYGVPDDDGTPRIVIRELDHNVAVDPLEGQSITGFGRDYSHEAPKVYVVEGATIMGREQYSGTGAAILQGLNLARREHAMLSLATSHYISAEVVEEINTAAALAANEPLRETDVFCPVGFAVLEEPMVVSDVDPETGAETDDLWIHIRAIGWHVHDGIANLATGKVGKGVSIFFYTTAQDYEDGYYRALIDSGRTPPYEPEDVDRNTTFIPIEVLPWTFDVPWDARHTVGYIPGTVPEAIAYERRWFFAFQRLMWQQIIVHRKDPTIKRPQHRRWKDKAKAKPFLDYTVLRLRRTVDPLYEATLTGTGTPLDHRVLVRGHWRNQYVPSLGPARDAQGNQIPETHRLIWIEAHWRGPEDAPIGAMEHATAVVR